MSDSVAKVSAGERHKIPSLLVGIGHIGALWALAVVQPMLSLLGETPEFFVARDNTPGQVVLYALSLAFGPPLLALLIEFLAGKFSSSLRWGIHLLLMAGVGSLLALSILNRYLDAPAAQVLLASGLTGILGTLAYSRFRFPRAFMDILIPAPVVVLVVFFFFSPASEVLLPKSDPEPVEVEVKDPAPVVIVAFDEFPLATLMKNRDSIDESRYPNFADLASQSNWYLNVSASGAFTPVGLPAILTGQKPSSDRLPIASEYPESVFTLLGGSYDRNVHEFVTAVCPEALCPQDENDNAYGSGTGSLFADLSIVSQHLILPKTMRGGLPDISTAFGGFGKGGEDSPVEGDEISRGATVEVGKALRRQAGGGPGGRVEEFLKGVDQGSRESLNFLHLLQPHYPWNRIPTGQTYTEQFDDQWTRLLKNDKWGASQRVMDVVTQRALLDVGFTDRMLGEIRKGLEDRGVWDEALVVVTADHGGGFTPGVEWRYASSKNLGWVASVPLFIKEPGQREARLIEQHTCATSTLPRIARILGIDYPWEEADCPRDRVSVLNSPVGSGSGSVASMVAQRDRNIRYIQKVFTTGTGWDPVYRSGPNEELIGRAVEEFERIPEAPGVAAIPLRPKAVEQYDPTAMSLPGLLQRGRVEGVAEDEAVAIAVNGRIEGTGWTFGDPTDDRPVYSVLLPPSALRKGFNQVDVYLIGPAGESLQMLYSGTGAVTEPSGA